MNIKARYVLLPLILGLALVIGLLFIFTGFTAQPALAAAALAAGKPVSAIDSTPIPGGTILTHTTWTLVGSPYIVQGSLTVAPGIILTVEAGVAVQFNSGTRLWINAGTLVAEGTPTQTITFTTSAADPIPGSWQYLYFGSGSSASLSYCDLAYAGQSNSVALYVDSSDVQLDHCNLHDNTGDAIRLQGAGLAPTLQDLTIADNSGIAVYQNTVDMTPAYANLDVSGNGTDAIVSAGGNFTRDASLSPAGTTPTGGLPFVWLGPVDVNGGNTLTVNPGVELRFPSGFDLEVQPNAALLAQGTPTQPITFTADLTSPLPGSWRYFYFHTGSSASLSFCDLAYAGQSNSVALYVDSSDVHVQLCRIHHNLGDGLRVRSNAQPYLSYNRIEDNIFGLRNDTPATQVDARDNWWGDASGPYHPVLNPGGLGNAVSDGVLFDPWLGPYAYFWLDPQEFLLHGQERLSWYEFSALQPDAQSVEVQAVTVGQQSTLGAGLPRAGELTWDTTAYPDGQYELHAVFRDAYGQVIADVLKKAAVNNNPAVTWHSGRLANSETWDATTVHVVEEDLTIPAGITLTIQAGAVVKFEKDTHLTVQDGGVLDALATSQAPIVLTSLADDTAGGDTNLDGSDSIPLPGDWAGITVQGAGQANLNEYVDLRYGFVTHAGTLPASETWDGTFVHWIVADVVVPSGVTLTVEPGAVVKFDPGKSLTVNPGGTLIAEGEVAQPIVFTSIRDDSAGGDSNHDGTVTSPAAGDWYRLQINGGTASLNYAQVRYGAGTDNVNGALLRTDGAASLTIANSVLNEGLYTGLLAWGGQVTIANSLVLANDRGISAHPGSTVNVVNCTVDDNRINLLIHGGTLNTANTLVTDHLESGFQYDFGTIGELRYNDAWSPVAGALNYRNMADPTGTNGNLSIDPGYKDSTGGNYRLQYVSPAIDAADGGLAPETDFMGAPRYDDPRTPNTGLPDASGAYPDLGIYEFVETAESNIDLVVTDVQGPLTALAGETVTVTWTVANLGPEPPPGVRSPDYDPSVAVGPWHDAVSLAGPGGTLAADEALVAEGVTLAPGESHTFQAEVRVPGGIVASYHWQVRANARGEVFEGQNSANNTTASTGLFALDLPELLIDGAPLAGQFAAAGESHWFKLNPAINQDILISLAGEGGALELYLGRGYLPTLQAFDASSAEWNSPGATLAVENAWPETYYVLAYARSLPGVTNFAIQAHALNFGLISADPASVGNAGPVTLLLRGGQLGADMACSLIAPDETAYPATGVYWENSTAVYATFDLSGAATGLYDIRVTAPGGGTQTLPNAVQVNPGTGARLVAQISAPATVRVGRVFYGTITYQNAGDADLPAPVLIVSITGQPITPVLPADASGSAGPAPGLRLHAGDDYVEALQVIAVAPDGPAGVLRPGQQGEIVFSAKAEQVGQVAYHLTYHTADSSEPVDWVAFESAVHPEEMPPEEWQAVWAEFTAQCGQTWGGYVSTLDRYATLQRQRMGDPQDLLKVFRTAILEIHHQLFMNVSGKLYEQDASHPLGGSGVLLSPVDPELAGYWPTGNDGVFYLDLAPGIYTVTVPGYQVLAPLTVTVPHTGRLTGLEVFALGGSSIAGRITRFGSGQPLEGVLVQAADFASNLYPAVSDADGYYTFEGLPTGSYTVTAGGGDWGSSLRPGLFVAPGLPQEGVDFAIDPAITLSGFVTRAADGAPVAGASLLLQDQWARPFAGTTDDTGFYTVTQLAPGSYTVRVVATGYGSLGPHELAVPHDVTQLAAGFTLATGAEIDVTALDAASSQPLAGAQVLLAHAAMTDAVASALTDAAGQASLVDLPAGDYVLSVELQAHWTVTETLTLNAGDHLARQYALHAAGTISGLLTGAGGTPLADVPLQAVRPGGAMVMAYSGANGSYAFSDLPQGTYAVSLWGGQYRQEVTIDTTAWQHTLDFALSGVSLAGRVLASDSTTPVENATVLLLKANQFIAAAVTDADGAYRFVTVMPGDYSLMAGAAGGLTASQAVTVAGSDITAPNLSLGSVVLSGDVQDDQGNPLVGVIVTLLPPEDAKSHLRQYFTAFTGADGAFQFAGLVAGTYNLEVYLPGYAIFHQAVTVSEPGPTQVEVRLSAGHAISGYVHAVTTGEALMGATVVAYEATTGRAVNVSWSDLSGFYLLADLPDGEYDLEITYPGCRIEQVRDLLIQGASLTRDVYLIPPVAALQGYARDGAARPVPGALLVARDSRGETLAYATTDYTGFYHFDQLPAGMYSLQAFAYGFEPGELTGVYLGDGQTVAVDLSLSPAAMSTQSWLAGLTRTARADPARIDGLPAWFFTLIDYLMEQNPEPSRVQGDQYCHPSIPAAECKEAQDEQAAAYAAKQNKDAAFDAWEKAHKMYNTNIWTSGAVFALQVAKLSGSVASLFIPESVAIDFIAKYGKAAFAITQLSPIAMELGSVIATWNLDWSSGPAALNSFNNLFTAINDINSYGVTAWNLFYALKGIKFDMTFFGAISVFTDALSLIQTTYDSWQVFIKAAGAVPTAQDNYFAAYAQMMARLRALDAANAACCDPEVECCDDNCCQGPNCDDDPPPPPDGDNGGGGSTNVVGSRDPNDKSTIGYGLPGFVAPASGLIYTIYFENVPTATVPAQQVFITDTLSPDLDWSSVELLGLGFNNTEVDIPRGLNQFDTWTAVPTDPNPVHVLVVLDEATGALHARLESIDPLTGGLPADPLAGFLPPDDESQRGEGYLAFRVHTLAGLADGAQILNQARIVFDVNLPIDTPVVTNTIDSAAPTSSVQPLPDFTLPAFTVSWSGSDGSGSGVAFYDLYVSADGGAFGLWQAGITTTQATFTAVSGGAYSFYSVATDWLGNHQPAPAAAQASTTVDADPPASHVLPLPPVSPENFTVSWSGDDGSGSGVATYDIYVSVDGGAFQPYWTGVTTTQGTYTGAPGHTYGFYSVATDRLGNRQPTPAAAQAVTEVPAQPMPGTTLYLPMVQR